MKRFLIILRNFLITILALIVLVPALLYVPPIQSFICNQVVNYLNNSQDDLTYSVEKVRIGFPLKLRVVGVEAISRKDGKVVFGLGELTTGLDRIPINKPNYLVEEAHLENLVVGFDSLTESLGILGEIKSADITNIVIDKNFGEYSIDKIYLDKPSLVIAMGPSAPDTIQDNDSSNLKIKIGQILMTDGSLQFDMSDKSLSDAFASINQTHYFDYNHIAMEKLSLDANDIVYDGDLIACTINNFTAYETNSQLDIQHLSTDFKMLGNEIFANDINLKMPQTEIAGDVSLDLGLFGPDTLGYVQSDIDGKISSHDLIVLAAPYWNTFDGGWPSEMTNFSLNARATKDTLSVQNLLFKVENHADLRIEGFGLNPLDNDNRHINLTMKGDLPDADFLLTTFVDKPENRSYLLPKDLFAELDLSQNKTYVGSDFLFKQEGIIVAEGNANYDLKTEAYHVNAKTDRLKLTDFVPSSKINGISTHVYAEGRHFKVPSRYTKANVKIQLDTLYYNNRYSMPDSIFDVSVEGTLENSKYFAQITSDHPYLRLDTQLDGEYSKDFVSTQGYIDLSNLDFQHLPSVLPYELGRLAMQSDINASYDFKDNAFADFYIHTLTYEDDESIHPFDEIDVQLNSEPGLFDAKLESGDALLKVKTDKSIAEIGGSVDTLLTELYRQIDNIELDIPSIQRCIPQAEAELKIARNNPFYTFIKYFGYRFRSIDVKIKNDSDLRANVNLYGLNFEGTRLDTVQFKLIPNDANYIYDLHANSLAPKAQNSYDIKASGDIFNDSITTCVQYINGKYITLYDVDAALALSEDSLTFHFLEGPTVYAQKFTVNDDNFISVSNFKNLEANALNIQSLIDLDGPNGLCANLQTHRLNTGEVGQQVNLNVEHLDLEFLDKTLDLEANTGGIMNIALNAKLLPESIVGDINSEVTKFHIGEYKADTLIFAGIANRENKVTDIGGKLTIDNFITLDAAASIGDSVDVNLGLHDLPLPLINGFMPTNINFSGVTNGEITIHGLDFEKANIDGYVQMHNAAVNYADCDANIHFPEDTVRIRRNRIRFRNYNLLFANNNPLVLSGTVDMRNNLTDPNLNLALRGEKVNIFKNSKPKNDAQYICGTLPATADMSIKGKVSDLQVSGILNVIEGTNLIYYMTDDPLKSTSKVDELVEFTSFRDLDRIIYDDDDRPYMVSGDKASNLDVNLKIEIVKNARVLAYLSKGTDDKVSLIGGGSLQLQCDANANIVMSGMYDINGGDVYYKLPMIPMSKEFSLSDASWISWNGPVGDPDINLIAIEKVRSSVNDDNGSRVVTFDVQINIAGTLNSLEVSFTCDAPEDGNISSEIASLTDEERSKQALLLLIAQTYSGPGTTSSMGLASANAAINSILNKEMESLLSNKLKNTDINVGIDTYDASGTARTDYSVKVSQRLFNDKIRVTVGGKISSGENADQGNSDAMINDVSLEYLVKEDGSSYAKLFRKTNYENILEGEVIETGVGYVQQRSAFKFKDLLLPGTKKREAKLQNMIKEMREKERAEEQQNRPRRNRNYNDSIQHKDSLNIRHINAVDSLQHDK